MKDRDVPVSDLVRVFTALGCTASVDRGYLQIERIVEGRPIIHKQHLHKGARDILRRAAVRRTYRRFGFTSEEFYGAL